MAYGCRDGSGGGNLIANHAIIGSAEILGAGILPGLGRGSECIITIGRGGKVTRAEEVVTGLGTRLRGAPEIAINHAGGRSAGSTTSGPVRSQSLQVRGITNPVSECGVVSRL